VLLERMLAQGGQLIIEHGRSYRSLRARWLHPETGQALNFTPTRKMSAMPPEQLARTGAQIIAPPADQPYGDPVIARRRNAHGHMLDHGETPSIAQ
jgi:hypothetical protein